jgi:hypothetical protein
MKQRYRVYQHAGPKTSSIEANTSADLLGFTWFAEPLKLLDAENPRVRRHRFMPQSPYPWTHHQPTNTVTARDSAYSTAMKAYITSAFTLTDIAGGWAYLVHLLQPLSAIKVSTLACRDDVHSMFVIARHESKALNNHSSSDKPTSALGKLRILHTFHDRIF